MMVGVDIDMLTALRQRVRHVLDPDRRPACEGKWTSGDQRYFPYGATTVHRRMLVPLKLPQTIA